MQCDPLKTPWPTAGLDLGYPGVKHQVRDAFPIPLANFFFFRCHHKKTQPLSPKPREASETGSPASAPFLGTAM